MAEGEQESPMAEINRKVLVAVDPSDNAKNAFEWYLKNVHRPDDLIIVTHCPEAPKLSTFSFRSGLAPPVDEWKTALEETNRKMAQLAEDYEGTLIQKKLHYKIRGENHKNPGEGIVKTAQEEKADLIVIGTRGLGAVKRAFLGSVSDYVVRNSNLPTVVIPYSK